jgi:hypothetical protein
LRLKVPLKTIYYNQCPIPLISLHYNVDLTFAQRLRLITSTGICSAMMVNPLGRIWILGTLNAEVLSKVKVISNF